MKLRLQSFLCAFTGIAHLFKTQTHARWHVIASVLVLFAGYYGNLQRFEWLALLLAMALVWTTEACNTAIELACDAITCEQNPLVGRAKDVVAGAVLLAAIFATLIAVLVFAPRLTGLHL